MPQRTTLGHSTHLRLPYRIHHQCFENFALFFTSIHKTKINYYRLIYILYAP